MPSNDAFPFADWHFAAKLGAAFGLGCAALRRRRRRRPRARRQRAAGMAYTPCAGTPPSSAPTGRSRGRASRWRRQALYVATFEPRYRAEWEAGVRALRLRQRRRHRRRRPGHQQDLAGRQHRRPRARPDRHTLLFPAVARGDHAAALSALELADHYVRVPLAGRPQDPGPHRRPAPGGRDARRRCRLGAAARRADRRAALRSSWPRCSPA